MTSAVQEFIEPIISDFDDDVTDFVLNPNGIGYIYHADGTMEKYQRQIDYGMLANIALVLAGESRNDIDEDYPCVETRLDSPRKMRIEILVPPAVEKPILCIRFYVLVHNTMEELQDKGMFDDKQMILLKELVQSRHNIVISGATGSGKTSLANALINEIADNERVIIIEDLREIDRNSPNTVPILTAGGFDGSSAVARAMRMRPDRIVYGEVRTAAAFDLLDAWNTGHNGGIGTVHAYSADGALSRLVKLAARKDPNVSFDICRGIAEEAVDVIIQIDREAGDDGRLHRHVSDIRIYRDRRV